MIAVTTSAMIAEMIGAMTDVAKTTTTATTTIENNGLHHHHLKGATPTVRSRLPAKQAKAIDKTDQTSGRSDMSTLKSRSLCDGLNCQSFSPGKIIWFTSLTPGLIRWSLIP
jgi:hypothetical protein